MSDFLSLFTNDTLDTQIIDSYTYNAIKALNLVYPEYNKIALSKVANTYHKQALNFKANVIKGYSFEDETKAGKIVDFLKNNLYDQFEVNISFERYLNKQLFTNAIYYNFFDQLGSLGGEIVKMYPLSSKHIYPDKRKRRFYQIIPDADIQFNENEPGTIENNTNYANNAVAFDNLGIDFNASGKRQGVFEYIGLGSSSDYFPDVFYLEALGSMKTNRLIGTYNQKWLENGTNFKNVLELCGIDGTSEAGQKIVADYKSDMNSKSRDGEIYIITNPTGKQPLKFLNPTQAQKEDFGDDRDSNREEILAASGLNTTLVGIQTNESSLTSTSQGESIKTYKETQLDNTVTNLESHYDKVFKKIDPSYNTKLKLKALSYEDESQIIDVETKEILNEKELILRGNYDEYVAYQVKRGKKEIKPDVFAKMVLDSKMGGMSFGE